jgi:uncharacterized protein
MLEKRNIKFISIIVAAAVFFVVWYLSTYEFSLYDNKIESVIIGNSEFRAEVVSGGWKMQKGLGKRNDLCDVCGMLFKFPQAGKYSFWMKDMRFPLDIVWIKNGEVVHIEKNVSENFSGILSPQVYANSVLEINAGNADRIGIRIGDQVTFKY